MAGFAQLNVRIPVELDERLEVLADALDRAKTALVIAALEDGCAHLEATARKQGLLEG